MTSRTIISILFALIATVTAFAAPAIPTSIKLKQPDGTVITVRLYGDESFHYYTTEDGYAISKSATGFYHYITDIKNGSPVLSQETVLDSDSRNAKTVSMLAKTKKANIINSIKTEGTIKKSKSVSKSNAMKLPAFPNRGEVRGLVILAQFKDKKFLQENTREKFNDILNKPGYEDSNSKGSAYDYFTSQSHGLFQPQFDVYGPVTLDNDYSYYGTNNSYGDDDKAHEMIREACSKLDSEIDFTIYDTNNDGEVDLVYVIYAGYGENSGADANTVWPHASDLSYYYSSPVTFDGKEVKPYACSCELKGNEYSKPVTTSGIGVFCHEFSHCLGLYDLYDTNGTTGGLGQGYGKYSIMDMGCYNNGSFTPCSYTAQERMQIGWLTPTELGNSYEYITLEDINTSNEAYIMYNSDNRDEYFLFENRQQSGWDKYIPSSGMLISHIYYDKDSWEKNMVNATSGKEGAIIVPANNRPGTLPQNHLYPIEGNNSFTDSSTPAAMFRDGTLTGKPITDIRNINGKVTFKYLDIPLDKPIALEATDITGDGFTANWENVIGAEKYTLTVTPLSGTAYENNIIDEDFSLFTAGEPTSPHSTDISDKLDNFTKQPGWNGRKVYQAGGMCKLGTTKDPGNLLLPGIDMPQKFSIIVYARDYLTASGNGDKSSLYISTRIANEDEFYEFKEYTLSDNIEKYVFTSDKGGNKLYIQIGTFQKRCIIERIVVLDDTKDNEQEEAKPVVIEDITGTEYRVTGLHKNFRYGYTVQAVSGNNVSEASDMIYVTTTSSISQTENNVNISIYDGVLTVKTEKPESVAIYSVDGKCIFKRTLVGETDIQLEKGIYIIVTEGKSYKTVI